MRIESNRHRVGTRPPLATLFGVVGLLAGGLGALWIGIGLPRPVCQFRAWTGVPCPTCGATRMGEALLRGDLIGALLLNPLIFIAVVALAAWSVVSTVRWLRGAPATRVVFEERERNALRLAGAAAIAAGWVYVILNGV